MARLWLMMAAANGFLAVALGAFGAHGLKRMLEAAPDGALRLQWWQTAAQYHLAHALALGLVAALAPHLAGRLPGVAGWLFVAGIVLSSLSRRSSSSRCCRCSSGSRRRRCRP